MQTVTFIKYTFSLFFLFLAYSCSNNLDEELIKQSFQTYKKSVLSDNGTAAADVVDKRTINHYERLLKLTLSADSTSLEALPLMDKFFVLAIRHTIDPDSILRMTGRGLFIHAINEGMIGKEGAMKLNIDNITIENDFAVAEFTTDGKNTGIKIYFYKDSGKWKFDLSSFFSVGNNAFKNLLKDCPGTENECLVDILETTFGKNGRDLWKPLKKD